jgi:4-hydroxy-tetrahydrodipicolinate reductase
MNIALIGYGKMGKTIEAIAVANGHTIGLKIDQDNAADLCEQKVAGIDVAIEFTGPQSAFENVINCLSLGLPVVCGSTGWLEKYDEAKRFCEAKNVNLFFEINKTLAKLMSKHSNYDVCLHEIHHTQKKDAPSGTAITLAEQVMEVLPHKTKWINEASNVASDLVITSERIDPAPGTHTITYASAIDSIEITHTAHNRKGFASGALLAAEFATSHQGIFTMKDVLGI